MNTLLIRKSSSFAVIAAIFVMLVFPTGARAYTYDKSHLPYSDVQNSRPDAIAISVLTEQEVVQGNPDGTFRPNTFLNRAEFMKIVLNVYPNAHILGFEPGCFPDVPENVWYEAPVCQAKALGIVRGNALPGLPQDRWPFEPTRSVQYEEAVKVLVKIFGIEVQEVSGDMWYMPYLNAARQRGIDVAGLLAGDKITRGQMARLVVNFMAYDAGELDELRAAEAGQTPGPSPQPNPDDDDDGGTDDDDDDGGSSSSERPVVIDPSTDFDTRAKFLLMGKTSSIVGAAEVFSELEPLNLTDLTVTLVDPATSIDSFLLYQDDGRLIGRAYLDTGSNRRYRLNIRNQDVMIPKGAEFSFYARASVKSRSQGAVSGEDVEIDSIGVQGTGEWSTRSYTKTTTEDYPTFEVARAVITDISNAGEDRTFLQSGLQQLLAEFEFEGETGTGDGSATLQLSELRFTVESAAGVTIANPKISRNGTSQTHDCTLSSTMVTCSGIPATIGDFEDAPVEIQFYADVTVPSGASNAFLRISLNQGGTESTPGAVHWTDGTTVFTWVPFDAPVARGTEHRY